MLRLTGWRDLTDLTIKMRQSAVVPNRITSNSQRRTKVAAVSDQDFYLIANNYYHANIKKRLKTSDPSTPKIIVLAKKGH
ncbi:hypothetical protein BB562_14425 [Lactiplantibacillus pentosus]|jgi:hypothetical protein|uniref:Uncharacterized protein n=1 Tax=Lactiplantibacillus pentosus TaxID=1589 RepID=A0AB37RH02_LACPE|nr:hypothetical protein BB562_14425 [Lactiplantibacillus pentosus]MCT3063814.1 hypothetical protein [Lactiplantibacillus pentosus]MCT3277370.1 hypothetical protein [Lactiplantibacillus pentosus]MCT3294620.1 hypothetical protein [Lactiplantibacillus pentosus]PRO89090.1 hypothetical protein C6Y13_08260 [Lactiplantibacillus pentosus]